MLQTKYISSQEYIFYFKFGRPDVSDDKESAMWETWVQPLGWEDPLEKGMTTYSSILPGEFCGQRSMECYSSWGHKELDTTEWLNWNDN